MGIAGLTAALERREYVDCWDSSFRLCNTRIVIDGGGLLYEMRNLCSKFDLDWESQIAGQYSDYYARVRTFFWELNTHGVHPLVVLDGLTASAKKDTKEQRKKERIKRMQSLCGKHGPADRRAGQLLPLWTKAVFVEALVDSHVAVVRTDWEADNVVAALGRHFNCPIMANDSDYFACDLPCGVLQMRKLDLRKPCTSSTHQPILFKRSGFASDLRRQSDTLMKHDVEIIEGLLPLACTLTGNDFVQQYRVKFLGHIDPNKDRTVSALLWLLDSLQVLSSEEGVIRLRDLLPSKTDYAGVLHSVEMYSPPLVVTTRLAKSCLSPEQLAKPFSLESSKGGVESDDRVTHCPGWLMETYHLALLPVEKAMADLSHKQILINMCVQSLHHEPPCNISVSLRLLALALISEKHIDSPEKSAIPGTESVNSVTFLPSRDLLHYGKPFPSVTDVADVSVDDRRQLLLLALRSNTAAVKELPLSFQLIVASLRYLWCRMNDDNCREQPRIFTRHLKVLLVGIANSCPDKDCLPSYDHAKTIQAQKEALKNWDPTSDERLPSPAAVPIPELSHTEYDPSDWHITRVHIFNAWQQIVSYVRLINFLLETPFPVFRLYLLYSGADNIHLYSDYAVEDVFQKATHQDLVKTLWKAVCEDLDGLEQAKANENLGGYVPTKRDEKAAKSRSSAAAAVS